MNPTPLSTTLAQPDDGRRFHLDGGRRADRFGAGADCRYTRAPERLIAEERTDQSGAARAKTGAGCARAAVMNHGRHAFEEPVVRGSFDDEHGWILGLESQTVTAASQDRAHAGLVHGLEHQPAHALGPG